MSASRVGKVRNRAHCDPSVSCRLTGRDREVIETIALHGAVARSQLMELGHFASVSRANRRLRLLFDQRYLRRTHVATGSYSLETVYVLGPNGVSIAAELAVIDRLELARHALRQPARAYLEHQLGVVSLRLSLLDTPTGARVVQFLTEPECRHEYEVAQGARTLRRIVKPDAFAEIEIDGIRWPFFLEFDRGHCSLPQMQGAFERYGLYSREGAFQSIYGEDSFEVLVVTTAGDRRISHLAAIAKSCGVAVRFATNEDIRLKGFFAPVWSGAPNQRGQALFNLSHGGRLP